VVGDHQVHDTTALMREDYQHEQEPARGRWYDEEIGGGDLLEVVHEERAPGL
jgi:hypothetical protein